MKPPIFIVLLPMYILAWEEGGEGTGIPSLRSIQSSRDIFIFLLEASDFYTIEIFSLRCIIHLS